MAAAAADVAEVEAAAADVAEVEAAAEAAAAGPRPSPLLGGEKGHQVGGLVALTSTQPAFAASQSPSQLAKRTPVAT